MQHNTSPFSLPLQPPRSAPQTRPHSVHASASSSSVTQPFPPLDCSETFDHDSSSLGLGVRFGTHPEPVPRRLSRDDTAASVSERYTTAHYLPQTGKPINPADCPLWNGQSSVVDVRPARRPHGKRWMTGSFSSSSESSAVSKQTSSLARKLSRPWKSGITDLRDRCYASTGRTRRASTPQELDASGSQLPKFNTTAVPPPTSPSKRNGMGDSDRPSKLTQARHLLTTSDSLKGDRKDTPAPPPTAMTRPTSRSAASTMGFSLAGGHQARQAAAASKAASPLLPNQAAWSGQDAATNPRRSIFTLDRAADSGADLSTYSGSNASCKDLDGDVEMTDGGVPSTDSEDVVESRDPIAVLPDEIGLQIFEFLDAQSAARCARVSKAWQRLAHEKSVWMSIYLRRWGRQIYTNPPPIQVGGAGCGLPNKPNQEWRRMYKARLALEANWRAGPEHAGKAVYLAGHTDSVYCVQFDEEKIITGSRDRTIRVWDMTNFTCLKVIGGPHVRPVHGPKVLRTVDYPDFHLATASVNGTSYGHSIYHVPSQWHDASILCLQYDDEILVTGSSDSDLIVWDIKTYQPIKRLQKHTGGVLDVALDAKHIVSCSKDSKIIVWNRDTLQPKGELSGHRGPVNAVQMRGNQLVSASGDGIARLWDIDKMKLIKEFSAKERGLAAVEFSEDMKHVLAGGNDTITYKFETDTGKEVQQFTGHTQLVRSLWLDSQNSRVVSGSYDLDLRVYDFNSGQELWRAEEWTTSWMLAAKSDYRRIVATSQDGRLLIVDFGLVKCKDYHDGQPIKDVNLLRSIEDGEIIEWRDPFEADREKLKAAGVDTSAVEEAAEQGEASAAAAAAAAAAATSSQGEPMQQDVQVPAGWPTEEQWAAVEAQAIAQLAALNGRPQLS